MVEYCIKEGQAVFAKVRETFDCLCPKKQKKNEQQQKQEQQKQKKNDDYRPLSSIFDAQTRNE